MSRPATEHPAPDKSSQSPSEDMDVDGTSAKPSMDVDDESHVAPAPVKDTNESAPDIGFESDADDFYQCDDEEKIALLSRVEDEGDIRQFIKDNHGRYSYRIADLLDLLYRENTVPAAERYIRRNEAALGVRDQPVESARVEADIGLAIEASLKGKLFMFYFNLLDNHLHKSYVMLNLLFFRQNRST